MSVDERPVPGTPTAADPPAQCLHAADRRALADLVRASLAGAVAGGAAPPADPTALPAALGEPRGCFVTLTRRGELRGCMGRITADQPLWATAATCAREAALQDPRFPAVTADELPEIEAEISVLTEPVRLEFAGAEDLLARLEPGRDGVVLEVGGHRATYLPQVWEKLPDKRDFLASLARKAGCEPGAWATPEASVWVYRVDHFAVADWPPESPAPVEPAVGYAAARPLPAAVAGGYCGGAMSAPQTVPDSRGHFGPYGGMFVPETLMAALGELAEEYAAARQDPAFAAELAGLLRDYAGRPTPLYFAGRLSRELGGAKIYLKREDLLHTGAHKINNALGQILLAQRMGKRRVIAETGAGQHGVATATVAARFGFACTVYMGETDMRRQALNVVRMRMLGAEVVPVTAGQATLKEAINEAMRDWVTSVRSTHYILGSALGAHPYPMMVRDFHRVIGDETRRQILGREGRLPDLLVACVGGGSNAIGLFYPFLADAEVAMVGVEAGGRGIAPGDHAARFQGGRVGVLQGTRTWLLADACGQIQETHSVSAGLDYPAVGPEHCYLRDMGRVKYGYATDDEVLRAFQDLSRLEGIIPALESAHAIAYLAKLDPPPRPGQLIVVNLSGRGDKDVAHAAACLGMDGAAG